MKINIHLTFDGCCREAFEFYESTMGGRIGVMLSYGRSPSADSVPENWQDKIVHGNLSIGDMEIAGIDLLPERYQKPSGFSILLRVNQKTKAEGIFNALGQEATILMPMQKTFWSPCYGTLIDRFGVPWEINVAEK